MVVLWSLCGQCGDTGHCGATVVIEPLEMEPQPSLDELHGLDELRDQLFEFDVKTAVYISGSVLIRSSPFCSILISDGECLKKRLSLQKRRGALKKRLVPLKPGPTANPRRAPNHERATVVTLRSMLWSCSLCGATVVTLMLL